MKNKKKRDDTHERKNEWMNEWWSNVEEADEQNWAKEQSKNSE